MEPSDRDLPAALARERTRVLDRLAERSGELTESVVTALEQEVEAYLPAVRATGARDTTIALDAMRRGGRLAETDAAALRQVATHRSAQGIPLHALLHAYQVGVRELWGFVLDGLEPLDPRTRATLLTDLSQAALRLTSEVSELLTDAYAEVSLDTVDRRARARHEVWDELLTGPRGATGFLRRRAEAVGYRLGAAHVVAVVALEDDADLPPPVLHLAQRKVLDALHGALGPAVPTSVGPRDEARVAVYAVPLGHAEPEARRAVQSALARLDLGDLDFLAAVGRVEPGIDGVSASYQQAVQTLQLARDCALTGRTLGYVDQLPSLLLSASPELTADLWRATVEPLASDDERRGLALVHTAEVLLAVNGNRVAAAKRLHLHRHTLASRIQRIEALSGCALDDSGRTLLLALGLRAHHLLSDPRASS